MPFVEELDLTVNYHPIRIKKPLKAGQSVQEYDFYTIHVMSGTEKGKWQNAHNKRHVTVSMEASKGKGAVTKMQVTNAVGMDATILEHSMRGPHPKNSEGELDTSSIESTPFVSYDVVVAWPGTITQKLADIARSMNGLTEEGEDQLKADAKNE